MNPSARRGRQIAGAAAVALAVGLLAMGIAAAGDEPKEDDAEDGAYVQFSKEHPLGEVRSDRALVYVLRPTSMGFAIKSFFLCDDEILGINKGSSYFFAHVAPGKRVFWSKSENVDALELEVEAGKTYYIQQRVQMGGFRARTKLEVLDEAAGKKALEKCDRHATMTPRGVEKGKEIAREHKGATQKDLERRAKKEREEESEAD